MMGKRCIFMILVLKICQEKQICHRFDMILLFMHTMITYWLLEDVTKMVRFIQLMLNIAFFKTLGDLKQCLRMNGL